MKSRYDRNQELYEKVKNNDFEDYNSKVTDFDLDFEGKDVRKNFHEKKRLSVYFDDIEKELETANSKLNTIGENSGLEIKKNVDLKNLIEQAKKNHREQGGNIFSNTQYEILSSLNVEESEAELAEDADLVIEDILGETRELNLPEDLVFDDNFAGTMVDLNVLNPDDITLDEEPSEPENALVFDDNFTGTMVDLSVIEEYNLDSEEDDIEDLPFADFVTEDYDFVEEAKNQDEGEVLESFDVVEEDVELNLENSKDLKEVYASLNKNNTEEELEEIDIFDEDEEYDEDEKTVTAVRETRQNSKKGKGNAGKNDKFLTLVLIFLIISIMVVGFIIASQYIGGM